MNKNKLLNILITSGALFVIVVIVYLAMANITLDIYNTEVVYPKTSLERMSSIFESELEKVLKSGAKILFRGGDMFIQFIVSKEKHLVMMAPLSVSITYAKPATWARFFIKTQYHNIALSAADESRLREIPELRDAPVKINSKGKSKPERFIEAELGTDAKRASEIAAEIIKIFQIGPDYKVSYTHADFRDIRW